MLAEGDSEAIAPLRRVSSASSAICLPILLASTCELMRRDISLPPGLPFAAKQMSKLVTLAAFKKSQLITLAEEIVQVGRHQWRQLLLWWSRRPQQAVLGHQVLDVARPRVAKGAPLALHSHVGAVLAAKSVSLRCERGETLIGMQYLGSRWLRACRAGCILAFSKALVYFC